MRGVVVREANLNTACSREGTIGKEREVGDSL